MVKRVFLLLLLGVAALALLLLYNTFTFQSKQAYESVRPAPRLSDTSLIHLQRAIQYRTISVSDPATFDSATFRAFHQFLREAYPRTHAQLELQTLVGAALLYKWQGADEALKPYVLMAHQDVVPVEEAALAQWSVEPFAGTIRDESIWGRGAADDKISLIGIMEAVEKLLAEGFIPQRTIYLAFGHDEEVGGSGARAATAFLNEQNVTAELVLDEGGFVTRTRVPGMHKPVALIGTAEKGYLTLDITVQKEGGHSSQPEKESAMTVLMNALLAIQENPFPAGFSEPTDGFIDYVGPEMPYPDRIVFANKWLFSSLIVSIYEQSRGGNALVRTTAAPTIFHSGIQDNVIPSQATATVNFRLLPGDGSQEVLDRVKEIIADERVEISINRDFLAEPSAVTPIDGYGFKTVAKMIHQVFPETVVTPFLMIGGTDSRQMEPISNQIIKFSPMEDPEGFHGVNERVTIKSYTDAIWFFENLLRTAGPQP
jgi:carboxypeptidase PM20D1